jgi:heterokaryon incompatibility protein (HET)
MVMFRLLLNCRSGLLSLGASFLHFDLKTKFINVIACVMLLFRYTHPLRKGLEKALQVQLLRFIMKYLFGIEIPIRLRAVLLFTEQRILTTGGPGADDLLREFYLWMIHDGPLPPHMVSTRSVVKAMFYYVPYIWCILDLRGFLRMVEFVCRPLMLQAVFWIIFYLFSGSTTIGTPMRAAAWALSEPVYWVPTYGAVAYILALRGNHIVLDVFSFACWAIPDMSKPSQALFRYAALIPICLVYFLTLLPFNTYWLFRHKLNKPLLRTKRKYRLWLRKILHKPPASSSQEMYEYVPLKEGEIRLLEVYRVKLELHCRILCVKLTDSPRYEAMSYTWGSSELFKRILVDGKWMEVTLSAYELLQSRASILEPKILWLDCICINQADVQEKNVQIPLMGEIYSRAMRVVVWLGWSPDAEEAFSLLEELRTRPILQTEEEIDGLDFAGLLRKLNKTRPQRYEVINRWDSRFAALGRLLNHAYFFRMWIIQEIFFGSVVHIWCDGSWIEWKHFVTPLQALLDPNLQLELGADELYEPRSAIQQIYRISLLKDEEHFRILHPKEGSERLPLCQLLASIRKIQASDSRDMVYGLLNLSRDADVPEFAPKYSQEPEELYLELGQLFIQRNELLDVLCRAGIGYLRKINTLPSWVADWSCVPLVFPLSWRPYNTSKDKHASFRLLNPRHLSVTGVHLDKISLTSEYVAEEPPPGHAFDEGLALIFLLDDAEELLFSLPEVYVTGQSREEAFWRTLIGDTTDDHELDLKRYLDSIGLSPYAHSNRTRPASHDYGVLFKQLQRCREIFRLLKITKGTKWDDIMQRDPAELNSLLQSRAQEFREAFYAIYLDRRFISNLTSFTQGRKFATTDKGYMAMVPPLCKSGDDICVIYGAKVPFAIRRCTGLDMFELVGECYVHGFMDGEALHLHKNIDRETEFILV